MLIAFTLQNFRSYKEAATLSLADLKWVALSGLNGAGKSAVLAGLTLLQQMVVAPTEQITDRLPYQPFAFDTTSDGLPTQFAVTIERGGSRYRYALSYDATRILSEELAVLLPGGQSQQLFLRQNGGIVCVPAGKKQAAANTRPNALFLQTLQAANYQPAIAVFSWFAEDLVVLGDRPRTDLVLDDWLIPQLTQFLHAVGSEVAGVTQRQLALQFLDGSQFTRSDLALLYEKYDEEGEVVDVTELPLRQASTGTQQLVAAGLAFITAQVAKNPQTVIADEFASAVRPEVATALLALVASDVKHSQLLFSTGHEVLLSSQTDPQQRCLAEKNYRGESTLRQGIPAMTAHPTIFTHQRIDGETLRTAFTTDMA